MRRRHPHQHRHGHPSEERLREIVDEFVPRSNERPAYLAFTRELMAAERHKQLKRQAQAPDYSLRTKRVVLKYFRRGLHGRAMWRIGEALIGRMYPAGR